MYVGIEYIQKTDWRYQSVAEKMFVYPSIIITKIDIKIEECKIKSNILQLSIINPCDTDVLVPKGVFLFPENIAEKTNLFSAGGYMSLGVF